MKCLIYCFLAVLLSSCATAPKTLYSWYGYTDASYSFYKENTDDSRKNLLDTYHKIISRQRGTRNTVPPGIYAEYGYLLVQSGQTDQAMAMFSKEVELYPESKVFVERIIAKLEVK